MYKKVFYMMSRFFTWLFLSILYYFNVSPGLIAQPTHPLSITFEHMVDLSVIKPDSKGVKCSTKGSK